MSSVRELHDLAMLRTDEAFAARRKGDRDEALRLFRAAFEHEAQAAAQVVDDLANEPTRSVLLRSAATLALDCGEIREAERLVATALTGNPPAEIANELRELFVKLYEIQRASA